MRNDECDQRDTDEQWNGQDYSAQNVEMQGHFSM